jgi:hypothetical protein
MPTRVNPPEDTPRIPGVDWFGLRYLHNDKTKVPEAGPGHHDAIKQSRYGLTIQ